MSVVLYTQATLCEITFRIQKVFDILLATLARVLLRCASERLPPPSLFLPSVQQPEAASCMLSPLPPANQSNWQLLEMCACLYSPAQARDGRALEFRPRLILNQRCQMAAHHFGVGIRELSCTSLGRNCFVFFPTENECWRTVRDGAITENCISVIALNVIRTDS